MTRAQVEKKPMAKRLLPPLPTIKEKEKMPDSTEDTDMLTDNFDSESEDDLHIICNVVYILPAEYDMISEVMEEEDDSSSKEVECPKPLCFYVMNEEQMTKQNDVFKKPDEEMKRNLKPLYIRAK